MRSVIDGGRSAPRSRYDSGARRVFFFRLSVELPVEEVGLERREVELA